VKAGQTDGAPAELLFARGGKHFAVLGIYKMHQLARKTSHWLINFLSGRYCSIFSVALDAKARVWADIDDRSHSRSPAIDWCSNVHTNDFLLRYVRQRTGR
jgi:hypothetical protein